MPLNCEIELDGRKHRVSMQYVDESGTYQFQLDGQPCSANAHLLQKDVLSVLLDGKSYRILFDPRPGGKAIVLGEHRISYSISDPRSLHSHAAGGTGDTAIRPLIAPMPGRILRVMAGVGEHVEMHQSLIVIEAMKMQNELKAPKTGVVSRIAVEIGATVQSGELLLLID